MTDVEAVVQRFYEASRAIRETVDQLIESGRKDNDEISALNKRLASELARSDV